VDAVGVHGQSHLHPVVDQEQGALAESFQDLGLGDHGVVVGRFIPVLHHSGAGGHGQGHVPGIAGPAEAGVGDEVVAFHVNMVFDK
jgi:hypothetical protein